MYTQPMRRTSQPMRTFFSFSSIAARTLVLAMLTVMGCAHLPTRTARTMFTYAGPGTKVCVSGTMNGWSLTGMTRHAEHWDLELPLRPGRYAYVLVIDGSMQPDPEALLQEDDGFGNINSILVVP